VLEEMRDPVEVSRLVPRADIDPDAERDRKCATPLRSAGSCRVPTSTQMPSETVSTVSTRSVATRNPLAKVDSCDVMLRSG